MENHYPPIKHDSLVSCTSEGERERGSSIIASLVFYLPVSVRACVCVCIYKKGCIVPLMLRITLKNYTKLKET